MHARLNTGTTNAITQAQVFPGLPLDHQQTPAASTAATAFCLVDTAKSAAIVATINHLPLVPVRTRPYAASATSENDSEGTSVRNVPVSRKNRGLNARQAVRNPAMAGGDLPWRSRS